LKKSDGNAIQFDHIGVGIDWLSSKGPLLGTELQITTESLSPELFLESVSIFGFERNAIEILSVELLVQPN